MQIGPLSRRTQSRSTRTSKSSISGVFTDQNSHISPLPLASTDNLNRNPNLLPKQAVPPEPGGFYDALLHLRVRFAPSPSPDDVLAVDERADPLSSPPAQQYRQMEWHRLRAAFPRHFLLMARMHLVDQSASSHHPSATATRKR